MNAADILVESGLENYRAGHFSEAKSAFQQALTQQPDHPGALNLLGVLTQQQGNVSQAIAYFQQALAAMPGWPEAWYNLGNALRDGGDVNGACNAYRQALALQPDFCDALNNLGLVLMTIGAYDEAVAAFRTALIHAPENSNIINNLSALFLRMGRSTEAAILLAGTEPEDAVAHNNRCLLLRSAGHLSQATLEAHLAIDLDPSYVEAYNSLGLVLIDGRDLVGAAEAFSKALSIRFDFLDAKINLGIVRHLQGELDEALAIYDRLLVLHPNDARIFNHRGLTLLEMNRFDQAMDTLEQTIALAPKWPEGYVSMARLMTAIGRLDTAAILCQKALAIDPNDAAARHEHATVAIMVFLGQVLSGNEPDESATALPPSSPRALRPGMLALENLFTASECAAIIASSAGLPPLPAQRPLVPTLPDFTVLPLTSQSQWIYRRIGALARTLNHDIYRFDLNSGEPFQLIQWGEGGRGEGWRSAAVLMTERPLARKLSLIVQLNDERDFEGGAIELWQADKPVPAPRRLGEGLIFPAPALHRSAPVTRGIRQTLLCNFNGPRFR